MRGNRRKDTRPELLVRKALREIGFPGYRLQWRKAPGRPDIAFPGRRIAIFVHGCFWHRCPTCDLRVPKTNRGFWERKFQLNVERDQRKQQAAIDGGWKVKVLWECRIIKEPEKLKVELLGLID